MSEKEYLSLVDYFKVDLADAFEARQLELDFEEKKGNYVRK